MLASQKRSATPSLAKRDAGRGDGKQGKPAPDNEGDTTNKEDEHADWQFVKDSLTKL